MSKEIWMNEERMEEKDTETDEEFELNDIKGFVDHVEWVYLHTDQEFDSGEMVQHLGMLEEIKQLCNDIRRRAEEENKKHIFEIADAVSDRVRDVQRMIEKRCFKE